MSSVGNVNPTEPQPRKKLSILILQLGEADEVYRSLMALKAVKFLYPEMDLHVITRKSCSEPVKHVEWITSVIEVPQASGDQEAMVKVAQWIEQIIHQNYDILVNWTSNARYRRMAALSTTLIPAIIKVGDYIRDDLTIASFDAWTMYRNAWMLDGIEQDIHYTDVVTTQLLTLLQIHAGDPVEDQSLSSVTSKYFFKIPAERTPESWINRSKKIKWVGVNLENAPERTSEWIEMILRRHPDTGVAIFGDVEEGEWAEHPRVITFAKELPFIERSNVIAQCQWFFSAHHEWASLASLLNVRVFFQGARTGREFDLKWTETGPYGNGHIAYIPKEEWKPEVAYATWSFFDSEWFHKNTVNLQGHFENLEVSKELAQSQIYRARIRPANEGGGVSYELAGGATQDFEFWIYRVRGQMARAWFCGWLPSVEKEVSKLALNPELVKRIRALNESSNVIQKIVTEGRSTALELSRLGPRHRVGHIMSVEDRGLIEEHGKKLLEVDALMTRVIQVEPELRSMAKWYQQLLHNLTGETITEMAMETVQAFDLVSEGVELMTSYTQKTLDRAKPRAVTTTATVTAIKPLT